MSEVNKNKTESFKEIGKNYSKAELVKKTLTTYNQLGEILKLVSIALPNKKCLSPAQLTLLDTSKAKEIREDAISQLHFLISAYNKSIEDVKGKE